MPLSAITTPGRKDLTYTRGDSFFRTFTLSEDGAAIDLTGWAAVAEVYDRFPIDNNAALVDTFSSVIPGPPTDGIIEIRLTTVQTDGADMPSTGGWRLKISLSADPTANTHTLLEGEFKECRLQ